MSDSIEDDELNLKLKHPNMKDDDLNYTYTDGTETYVLNGQILQSSEETQTLVLHDEVDVNQYLINNDKGELLLANIQNDTAEQVQDDQVIQYVESDNLCEQIVYIDETAVPLLQDNIVEYQLAEFLDDKNPEEESNTVLHPEETDVNEEITQLNSTDWCQYVIQDSGLHQLSTLSLVSSQTLNVSNTDSLDVSSVTGKDLNTGEVITLDTYVEKINRKSKKNLSDAMNNKKSKKEKLNEYINKKFDLGLNIGGKPLIGKILHIDTKDELTNNKINVYMENKNENIISNCTKSIVDTQQVSYKNISSVEEIKKLERVSKTLCKLMSMEKVHKQLVETNIFIKVIDTYIDYFKNVTRKVSFLSGYMEQQLTKNNESKWDQTWIFVPETPISEKQPSMDKQSQMKYSTFFNIDLSTTFKGTRSFTKVILDARLFKCDLCKFTFNNNENLSSHLNVEHKYCELCNCSFNSFDLLVQHQVVHVRTGKIVSCNIDGCKKYVCTDSSLKMHINTHKLDGYQCPVCSYSASSRSDLKNHSRSHSNNCDICGEIFTSETNLNIHKKSHLTSQINILKKIVRTKLYTCCICQKAFMRQANLFRHAEIHKGADPLFKCNVCGCSYHYRASLTRHIVQNHMSKNRKLTPSVDIT